MKGLLTLFISFFFFQSAFSQSAAELKRWHTDSRQHENEARRVNALLDLADYHLGLARMLSRPKSVDSVAYYASQAEKAAVAVNDKESLGKAYIFTSRYFKRKKDIANADKYAEKAIEVFKAGKSKSVGLGYLAKVAADEERDLEVSLRIIEQAISEFQEAGNKEGEGDATMEYAELQMYIGKIPQSLANFEKCISLYRGTTNKNLKKAYSCAGLLYNQTGNLDKSLEYQLKAVSMLDDSGEESIDAAAILNYTAITYFQIKDSENADRYFSRAYKIAKKYDDQELKTMILSNEILTLMRLSREREAIYYLKEMERDYNKLPVSSQRLLTSRALMTYITMKDYKSAAPYVIKARNFSADNPPTSPFQGMFLPPLFKYHFAVKDYGTARTYADKYLVLAEHLQVTKDMETAHRMLFQLDSVASNFTSAIRHYELSQKYKDSLLNQEKNKEIASLQVAFESEKKDKNLLLAKESNKMLTKTSQLQQSELEKAALIRKIGIGFLVTFLIIIFLLYSRYRIKQRTNRMLESQKNEISQKNSSLERLVSEKQLLLKEIHHRVKNNLQIVMSLLNSQSAYLKDQSAITAIRDSQHRVQSMSLIHQKLYKSSDLTAINMPEYISELVEYLQDSFDLGLRIHFEQDIENIEMDVSQAVPLGLILNEAITNAIKYAFPTREGKITISLLHTRDNYFLLRIADNGIGLPANFEVKKAPSLGMRLMQGLSDDIEGQFAASVDNGTVITVEFLYHYTLNHK